jgi:glycosyltransferase involved in cell wall biosynthesis
LIKKKKEPIDIDLNLKKDDYFLSIGRLTKQKNFIFLIKCFSKIIKVQNTNIKLVIIGVGEEKNKIISYIKNKLEKNIFLLGYQKMFINFK